MAEVFTTPVEGDLKVFYAPQVPMKAFEVKAIDLPDAVRVLSIITNFSIFEYENKIKPDYSDYGGVVRYEADGEGGFEWCDVDQDELDEFEDQS